MDIKTEVEGPRRNVRPGETFRVGEIGIELLGYQTNKNGIQEIQDVCHWNAQFEKLKRFCQINGHCNVPKRYLPLGDLRR
jgi:hypothetical protein